MSTIRFRFALSLVMRKILTGALQHVTSRPSEAAKSTALEHETLMLKA